MHKLVEKIINLRTYLKLNIEYMATHIGISCEKYKLFESGKINLSENELSKCLEILGIGTVYERYANITLDNNKLSNIEFINNNEYNFGQTVDLLAAKEPLKLALLHIDSLKKERRFTFKDISEQSSMAANYFKSLGIKKDDRVMLILKNAYQLWPIVVALHKIGAIIVPSSHMLKKHDLEFRINQANITSIISVHEQSIIKEIESCNNIAQIKNKISINGSNPTWHNYDEQFYKYNHNFEVCHTTSRDPMIIFFTSGTTNQPKGVVHSYTYPLSHITTAKFWQNVDPNGLHYTMSDSGWAKFFWGKIYGQWLCEAPIFAYDYNGRFYPEEILQMIEKYQITTVCSPATNYRMFNSTNLKEFNLSSVHDFLVAGEPLDSDAYNRFCDNVNNEIKPAYGMTEAAMVTGNLINNQNHPETIGTFNPMYDAKIIDSNHNVVTPGKQGQLIIKPKNNNIGMMLGYLKNQEIVSPLIDGYYHTGDIVYQDDNSYINFIGRNDEIIKTSGYKVAPPEVEDIITQLSYIKECAVIGVKDDLRGAIVTALVVVDDNISQSIDTIKAIQQFVKENTAPYKYPRKIVFVSKLPKTISGKIDRGNVKKLVK